jgi:hypothetical protein
MSNAVYPSTIRGLTFTVVKRPEFSTLIQTSPNRYELRLPQTINPIWHWSLVYDYLKDYDVQPSLSYTDLQTLMGFFLARAGQGDDFLFSDPDDHHVGPALIGSPPAPNPFTQLQLVSDNAGGWYSPIQRNLGGFYEDITDLDGNITVYANGVLQTAGTDYTVEGPGLAVSGKSFAGLYLRWQAEPEAPITAEFDFYFRVRFEMDAQDFEKFLAHLWTIGGQRGAGEVRLMTARPALFPAITVCGPIQCDYLLPVPELDLGLRRILINPRMASGTQIGGMCGSSAFADPNGLVPGTGISATVLQGPLSDWCPAVWDQFVVPDGISPSQYRKVYGVMQAEYPQPDFPSATGKMADTILGFGQTGNIFQSFTSFPRTTFVKLLASGIPANFDFSTKRASAAIGHSLPGHISASVIIYAVTMILDYAP